MLMKLSEMICELFKHTVSGFSWYVSSKRDFTIIKGK